MDKDVVTIELTRAEATVLFEWLSRLDDAGPVPIHHPADQKVLWILEGKLEQQVSAFAADYQHVLEESRKELDAEH